MEGEAEGLLLGFDEGEGEGMPLGCNDGAAVAFPLLAEFECPTTTTSISELSGTSSKSEKTAEREYALADLVDGIMEGLTEGVKVG